MRAAINNTDKVFKKMNIDKKDVFSNLEFRNCLRKLGIGIRGNEID